MLPTPTEHLPHGYPYGGAEPTPFFASVWRRAFELHRFECQNPKSHAGVISPVANTDSYCDCYERAYQELGEHELGGHDKTSVRIGDHIILIVQ
jgi:hypothetical protein